MPFGNPPKGAALRNPAKGRCPLESYQRDFIPLDSRSGGLERGGFFVGVTAHGGCAATRGRVFLGWRGHRVEAEVSVWDGCWGERVKGS